MIKPQHLKSIRKQHEIIHVNGKRPKNHIDNHPTGEGIKKHSKTSMREFKTAAWSR